MILVLDNYDSFVHNLARYLRQLSSVPVAVVRSDEVEVEQIAEKAVSAIVISPGPCGPEQAGCSIQIVKKLSHEIPILGVCLGHQVIAAAFGGRVSQSGHPVHGKSTIVHHDGSSALFDGIPATFNAGRYHSLVAEIDLLPEELTVTAKTQDQTVMAIQHQLRPCFGVQFHPESVLTEHGYRLLENFLKIAKVPVKDSNTRPTL